MKKHYWQPVRYWRSLRLLLSTQLKTTNRSIFPTGGTRALTLSGSYHTRFGPQIRNDTYLEYEAFAKKDWFDFYGYADAPGILRR